VEKSDPVNGWPLRAISLWDVMMMKHLNNKINFSIQKKITGDKDLNENKTQTRDL